MNFAKISLLPCRLNWSLWDPTPCHLTSPLRLTSKAPQADSNKSLRFLPQMWYLIFTTPVNATLSFRSAESFESSLLSYLKCRFTGRSCHLYQNPSHHHRTCHQPGLPPRKLWQPLTVSWSTGPPKAGLPLRHSDSAPPSQSKIILMVPRITLGRWFQKLFLEPWLLQVQISS